MDMKLENAANKFIKKFTNMKIVSVNENSVQIRRSKEVAGIFSKYKENENITIYKYKEKDREIILTEATKDDIFICYRENDDSYYYLTNSIFLKSGAEEYYKNNEKEIMLFIKEVEEEMNNRFRFLLKTNSYKKAVDKLCMN